MSIETKTKKAFNWSIVLAIIGIILTAVWKFYPVYPELRYNILANTSVLDLKAEVAQLRVSYDSIDLLKNKQNVSIILIEVRNDGNKDIKIDDYDQTSEFGMEIKNGTILNRPVINNSADNGYFKDIISYYNGNKIKFKQKLIDSDQFFTIKFLILHSRENTPEISPIGKISGMKKIEVTTSVQSNAELIHLREQNRSLLYFLTSATIIGLLTFIIKMEITKNKKLILLQNEIETSKKLDKLVKKSYFEFSHSEQLSLEEKANLMPGEKVYHERFGFGEIISIEKKNVLFDSKANIKFEEKGEKKLLLRIAQLYKADI